MEQQNENEVVPRRLHPTAPIHALGCTHSRREMYEIICEATMADSAHGESDPATTVPRCTATPSRSSTSQDLPWLQSRQSSVRSLGIVSPSVATQDKKLALSLCTQDEATKRPVSSFNEASLWAGRKTFTCARPQSLSDLHVAATSLLDDIGSADMCTGSCCTRLAG